MSTDPSLLLHLSAIRMHPPIRPMKQGDLDGLCGVYAIINAIRILCPEVDDTGAQIVFWRLIDTLDSGASAIAVAKVMREGIDRSTLLHLVEAASKTIRSEIGVRLEVKSVKGDGRRRSFSRLWAMLRGLIEGGGVAIIGLSGRHEHWTVGYEMTATTIRLLDSDDRSILIRSRCGLRRPALHRLDADDIFVLRRSELAV